jgi:CBS domain-containing protein
MKVSDILRVKGNTLYTVTPDEPLAVALSVMAEKDIGSLVVMELGDLVGMLTFREVIQATVRNGGSVGALRVRSAMDDHPLTCTLETDMDEVRRMMLDRHARYMPVMDKKMLMGVISFYDVAKAVVDSPEFREQDAQGLHPRLAGGKDNPLRRQPLSRLRRLPPSLALLRNAERGTPPARRGGPCAVALAWAARAQAVGAFLVRCVFAWVVVWDNPAP